MDHPCSSILAAILLTYLHVSNGTKCSGLKTVGHTTDFLNMYTSEFAEFPWMAAVIRVDTKIGQTSTEDVYQCGGSIIHPSVILTAAHCVKIRESSRKTHHWKVRAGDWNTSNRDEELPFQERLVRNVSVHPQYNSSLFFNDVALLRLEAPLKFDKHINSVCLPAKNFTPNEGGRPCFVTGWGKGRRAFGKTVLRKTRVPIVGHVKCRDALRKTRLGQSFRLHHSFVCAGYTDGIDVCNIGEGGSPLVCPVEGTEKKYQQVGIFSWRYGCTDKSLSGIYAHVSKLKEWIDVEMAKLAIEPNTYTES